MKDLILEFSWKNWKQHLEQFSPQKLYLSRKWVRSGIFLSVRPAQRLFGYLPKRYKNGNIFSALFASWYNSSVTEMKMYNLSSTHFDYLTLGVLELLLAYFVKKTKIFLNDFFVFYICRCTTFMMAVNSLRMSLFLKLNWVTMDLSLVFQQNYNWDKGSNFKSVSDLKMMCQK